MKDVFLGTPSYEIIAKILFENYESIYEIDAETSAYRCYHESESYSELKIAGSGADFFAALHAHIPKVIHPEDQEYVRAMLRRDAILAALETDKYYTFVYRLLVDGREVYHKIRATLETIDGRLHILLGVRDVDETIRQEQLHTEALASMYQKEKNHMEAILGSASGYLEVNLTKDLILERSPVLPFGRMPEDIPYSVFSKRASRRIAKNAEKYARISERTYLLACFAGGEKRASVSFSVRRKNGSEQPFREVFYLYRDDASGDVLSFCVIYDLTEQQRQEQELKELEHALQMSRIRNFTSQMQPHFLYNALGSIQEIVLEDPQYASELIGDFSTHLRSCIRAMAKDDPLPFSQELDNIRAYVNIEKMRFGEKLKVRYEIGADGFSILPLSIQPLVENAIRHGIYGRGVKGGTVCVRTKETKDAYIVEVEDDGVGFDAAAFTGAQAGKNGDSTGLQNIMFRLDKVMHASVSIKSAVGAGTKVTVSIPKGGGKG